MIIPGMKGLIYCNGDWNSPFCVVKLIEALTSLALLVAAGIGLTLRLRSEKKVSIFSVVYIQMILALLFNVLFCLEHSINAFYFMESYFVSIYFTTIVYQMASRLLDEFRLSSNYKTYNSILISCLSLIIICQTSDLIYRFFKVYRSCQQIFYLITGSLSFLLSLTFLTAAFVYSRREMEKIWSSVDPTRINNPLPRIWIWLSLNVLSQLSSLLQTLIFLFWTRTCDFSQNDAANETLKLIFELLSFHLGILATIVFYHASHRRQQHKTQSAPIELKTDIPAERLFDFSSLASRNGKDKLLG